MRRFATIAGWVVALTLIDGVGAEGRAADPPRSERPGPFDVVIAGGTTAAFAAAVASAESGARTALIEPTDWVGGQLTASGVPAVDEAWHKVTDPKTKEVLNVSAIARKRENMTPNFRAMLDATGNPGGGWVSELLLSNRSDFLDRHLVPLEAKLAGKLVVYHDTVIKSDHRPTPPPAGSRLGHRDPSDSASPESPGTATTISLSQDLADWYSPTPSDRFAKATLTFVADARAGHRDGLPRRDRVGRSSSPWPTPLICKGSRPSTAVETGNDVVRPGDRRRLRRAARRDLDRRASGARGGAEPRLR